MNPSSTVLLLVNTGCMLKLFGACCSLSYFCLHILANRILLPDFYWPFFFTVRSVFKKLSPEEAWWSRAVHKPAASSDAGPKR